MKSSMLSVLGLAVLCAGLSPANARAADACETNYRQEGSFFGGRTFSTWEDVPNISPAAAYKLIYTDAVKSGLRIASADKEMGIISAEQNTQLDGKQVTLPWNIVIEAQGAGSKISVTKTTPAGYATGQDYQVKAMCSVIATARKG